jgi:hypothetical protein
MAPTMGPSGLLAAGWSTSSGAIATALAAAVPVNRLANRGDGAGVRIRIIGNSAGGSGLTDERYIIASTAGTTPTIALGGADGAMLPLSFTPQAGDSYEMLDGSFLYQDQVPRTIRRVDTVTQTWLSLDTSNGYGTGTDNGIANVVLDEQYVPEGRLPGEGFLGVCAASATGVATLTGALGGADAGLEANEYANFQIRVTSDVANPQACGQRAKIVSHTSADPTVYTVTAWGVQPSASCSYVIEGIGDLIQVCASSARTYTKAVGGFRADAAWTHTGVVGGASLQIPDYPAPVGAGVQLIWPFGIRDSALASGRPARRNQVYLVRGDGTGVVDVLDLPTLTWSTDVVRSAGMALPTVGAGVGASLAYDPHGWDGQYAYCNVSAGPQMVRLDLARRTWSPNGIPDFPIAPWPNPPTGGSSTAPRMAMAWDTTGAAPGSYVYVRAWGQGQTQMYRCYVGP